MIKFFIHHYYERGASIVALYPFRSDFYKKMGFGYGTKMNQYQFKPHNLPRTNTNHLVYLTQDDCSLMEECHTNYAKTIHGMCEKNEKHWQRGVGSPKFTTIGYKSKERLRGFVITTFQKGKTGIPYSKAPKGEQSVWNRV